MAVVVIAELRGGTAEFDDDLQQRMGLAASPPAGIQVRMAGPTADGWRVISVWDSQDAFDVFRRDILEPAFQAAGRALPDFEIAELHSIRMMGAR